jgi:hypothetical protein
MPQPAVYRNAQALSQYGTHTTNQMKVSQAKQHLLDAVGGDDIIRTAYQDSFIPGAFQSRSQSRREKIDGCMLYLICTLKFLNNPCSFVLFPFKKDEDFIIAPELMAGAGHGLKLCPKVRIRFFNSYNERNTVIISHTKLPPVKHAKAL